MVVMVTGIFVNLMYGVSIAAVGLIVFLDVLCASQHSEFCLRTERYHPGEYTTLRGFS